MIELTINKSIIPSSFAFFIVKCFLIRLRVCSLQFAFRHKFLMCFLILKYLSIVTPSNSRYRISSNKRPWRLLKFEIVLARGRRSFQISGNEQY